MVNKEKASGRIMEWFFSLNKTLRSSPGAFYFNEKERLFISLQLSADLTNEIDVLRMRMSRNRCKSYQFFRWFPTKKRFYFKAESKSSGIIHCFRRIRRVGTAKWRRRKQLSSPQLFNCLKVEWICLIRKNGNRAELNSGDFRAESRN